MKTESSDELACTLESVQPGQHVYLDRLATQWRITEVTSSEVKSASHRHNGVPHIQFRLETEKRAEDDLGDSLVEEVSIPLEAIITWSCARIRNVNDGMNILPMLEFRGIDGKKHFMAILPLIPA